MWKIIKVQGTVGNAVIYAVYSLKNEINHSKLNDYLKKEFGEYCTIEYLESTVVPDFKPEHKIDRVLALDELV